MPNAWADAIVTMETFRFTQLPPLRRTSAILLSIKDFSTLNSYQIRLARASLKSHGALRRQ